MAPSADHAGNPRQPTVASLRQLRTSTGRRRRFYQGGAANVHLGEEFHHNRLSLIASIGAWGAPHRHAPLWNRRRVMDTATRLLYTDRVSVDGLLARRIDGRSIGMRLEAAPVGGHGRRRGRSCQR
jgi:hypothetical protein